MSIFIEYFAVVGISALTAFIINYFRGSMVIHLMAFIIASLFFFATNAQQIPTNPACGMQIRIVSTEGINDGEDKIVICDQCGRKAKVVIIACGEYCKFCEFHDPKGK